MGMIDNIMYSIYKSTTAPSLPTYLLNYQLEAIATHHLLKLKINVHFIHPQVLGKKQKQNATW